MVVPSGAEGKDIASGGDILEQKKSGKGESHAVAGP